MPAVRVNEFDTLRGVLVIAMVMVHVLANIGGVRFDELFVLWISVGFVFMSGMLGSSVLLKAKRGRSIVLRGARLVGLFVLLNLVLRGPEPIRALITEGAVDAAMFEILLPIGIVIMLLPVLGAAPIVTGAVCLTGLITLDAMHVSPYVIKFTAIGGIGAMAGSFRNDWPALWNRTDVQALGLAVVLGTLAIAVTGKVHAPLTIALIVSFGFFPAIIGIVHRIKPVQEWCGLMGRHSLLLYILHVAAIAALTRTSLPPVASAVLIAALCAGGAWMGDRTRNYPMLHRAYRLLLR